MLKYSGGTNINVIDLESILRQDPIVIVMSCNFLTGMPLIAMIVLSRRGDLQCGILAVAV